MKLKKIFCLFGLLLTTSLYGDLFDGDFGDMTLETSPFNPFKIEVDGDWIGKSDFDSGRVKNNSVQFGVGEIFVSYTQVLNPCYLEGIEIGVGEACDRLKWNNNPFFDQENFVNTFFSLSAASSRVDRMVIQAQVVVAFNNNHFNSEYCTVDLLFWNRYALTEKLGLHAGFVAQTGLKIDNIAPVIGFDYALDPRWQLNVIFPVDISLKYLYNCNFDFLVGMRFISTRQRVNKNETLSEGLFEYTNTGIEVGMEYHLKDNILLNIHAGQMFGGSVQVWNKHHDDSHSYSFKSAPYIGGNVTLKF